MKFVSIKKLLNVSIFLFGILVTQTVQSDTSSTKIEHQTEDSQLITKEYNTKKQINDSKLTNNTSDNNDKKKVLAGNNKDNSNNEIARNYKDMEMENKIDKINKTNNIKNNNHDISDGIDKNMKMERCMNHVSIKNNTIVLEKIKTENNNDKLNNNNKKLEYKINNTNQTNDTKKVYEKITPNNNNITIARNDNDINANDKINNTNNKKDINKIDTKSEEVSSKNKLEINLTNDKNISTQNSKSNANNTCNKSFEQTIKKESMEFIIWNLKSLEDLEQEIKEVFGTNKYDANIESNPHTKHKLLDMTKEIRKVYESIDDITIDKIQTRFNYIFEELICIMSGTNWRYNHGFIESTKPYEILIDYISYFTRLYANVLYYKQGTRTKGCRFFN
ncbi:MAG: hypothetical protein IJU54_02595 [Alphaproteobacteria bacterium]|nr:hypothetical protein [Alphaproteobacteria bacterium]